jgi:nucleoside-diphosphate-sugar epimerase
VKALVTGAAGFIGSHLADRLVADGATVVGIDSFTDFYPRATKERNLARLHSSSVFSLVESTLADADLPALLDGVTHVFHLAAQAGVRQSWGQHFHVYTVNNVEATQLLLEACVGRPIERLVYASSSSVYGDSVPLPMQEDARRQPVSPYGVTKLAAEQLCSLYHVSYGVLQRSPFGFLPSMGPVSDQTWGLPGSCGRAPAGRPCGSSATADRRATSPLWPTP